MALPMPDPRPPARPGRARRKWAAFAIIATLGQVPTFGQSDPRPLTTATPIDVALKGGEQQAYRVAVTAGQVLEIVALQQGIDVVLVVIDPTGSTVAEVDSPNGVSGPEEASLITAHAGDYRIVIKALEAGAAPGRFELRIKTLRDATSKDRAFHDARRISLEAARLVQADTPEALRAGVAKYVQVVPLWREAGLPEVAAGALNSIAILSIELRDYERTLEAAGEAAAMHEAAGNLAEAARALNHVGVAYAGLLDTSKAIETFERAIALADRAGVPRVQASLLNNLAIRYQDLGLWSKGLEVLLRAQPYFATAGDIREQASGLENLALSYHDLDEHQRALDTMTEALRLRRVAKDRRGESTTLNNLGLIYSRLGDDRTALTYWKQALEVWQGTGERDVVSDASTLLNISGAYERLGDLEASRAAAHESMRIRRSVNNPPLLAAGLQALASSRLRHKAPDYNQILRDASEALAVWQALKNRNNEATILLVIGQARLGLGDRPAAADALDRALALCRAVGNQGLEAATLFHKARLAAAGDHASDALSFLTDAMAIQERLRTRVSSPQLRGTFFATSQAIFDLYIDVALKLHAGGAGGNLDHKALEVVERSRARSLLDGLTAAGVDVRRGVDPQLLRQERALQDRISQQAKSAGAVDNLLAELEQVRTKIRSASPAYAAIAEPAPLTMQTIQQDVVDTGTVLLEYAFTDERAYVWAVTPTGVTSVVLGSRAEVVAAARRVHELVSARNVRPAGESAVARQARLAEAARDWPAATAALSRLILTPVANVMAGQRLVVVTAGVLHYVPFGALPAPGSTEPLLARHEIVHVPSASALAVLRRERSRRTTPDKTLAVIADPVFDVSDSRLAGESSRRVPPSTTAAERDWERAARTAGADAGALPRLRYSRDEAEAMLALVRPADRLAALDFQANRDLVLGGELARYRIVHLATHGFLSSDRPEVSGLALSMVAPDGSSVDGFVRLHQVYGLRLSADLVVLSACQTALGQDVRGEGIVGLARGFMYAGASRVVSSLWKVDDQATAELMKLFYRNLLGSARLRPAEALRAAQNSLRRQPRWSDPYYWAGFTLQGEWR